MGGTGVCGSAVVAELRRRGHQPRVLSRRAGSAPDHYPVDLTTGVGLATALAGADAVIDASSTRSTRAMRQVLVAGSERLLRAAAEAGVGHHVVPSIVGIDLVPLGYYRVKVEQEQAVLHGPVPASVVRSTQFHELLDEFFGKLARFGVLPRSPAPLQPIAAREAATALVDTAERGPGERVEVAGPEIMPVTEFARAWLVGTSRRRLLVPVAAPGKYGRALRAGALTAPDARRGTVRFVEWLAR